MYKNFTVIHRPTYLVFCLCPCEIDIGSWVIMEQSQRHCGRPADTMFTRRPQCHRDELDGCSWGQTPGATCLHGKTVVQSYRQTCLPAHHHFCGCWYKLRLQCFNISSKKTRLDCLTYERGYPAVVTILEAKICTGVKMQFQLLLNHLTKSITGMA